LQIDCESGALQTDSAAFQQQVCNAYITVAKSVNDELARQQNGQADNQAAAVAPATAGRDGQTIARDTTVAGDCAVT